MSQPIEAKVEEFNCQECSKKFQNHTSYYSHMKTKHSDPEPAPREQSSQPEPRPPHNVKVNSEDQPAEDEALKSKPVVPAKASNKNKGFEQYQQDLEDKIYSFLGELGEKNADTNKDSDNSQEDSDRMMGQANYLENNVVRTPFENEFDVKKEMPDFELATPELKAIFDTFRKETLALHQKLSAERQKWEFRDPIDIDRQDDAEFSLVNVANVLNNYKKKGLTLEYPEFGVFLLWLAKICKIGSWKEFYFSVGYTISEFQQYLKTNKAEKTQPSWKLFTAEFGTRLQAEIPALLDENVNIMDKDDLNSFLKLYFKWVLYFDLF